MIEWIPIKEFLEQNKNSVEPCLAYNIKTNNSWVTNPSSTDLLGLQSWYTHAAKINLPNPLTLEEKFEAYRVKNMNLELVNLYTKELAKIAKEHYEGNK